MPGSVLEGSLVSLPDAFKILLSLWFESAFCCVSVLGQDLDADVATKMRIFRCNDTLRGGTRDHIFIEIQTYALCFFNRDVSSGALCMDVEQYIS